MELTGFVQKYEWGKIGNASIVANLYGNNIDPQSPYAELWMGTHPNGQTMIKEYNISLQEYIEQNQEVLGNAEYFWKKYQTLPFLLKVLSVRKALSIQCHPPKDMAQVLHNNFPELYKDPNHKPEMAIALTKFHALCGFRPTEEIKENIVNIDELQMVITPSLLEAYKDSLDEELLNKILFSLFTKNEGVVEQAVHHLFGRFEKAGSEVQERYKYALMKELHNQFPGDSGVFMIYFLNEVFLEPGEAMYIPAGIPHAYISGDCVECMANSDNVVRAGLTPKYKDIETLLTILDYSSYTNQQVKIKSRAISPYTTHYHPPIPDFGVSHVIIPKGISWISPAHDSCQIFFVLKGEGVCVGEKLRPLKSTAPSTSRPGNEDQTQLLQNPGEMELDEPGIPVDLPEIEEEPFVPPKKPRLDEELIDESISEQAKSKDKAYAKDQKKTDSFNMPKESYLVDPAKHSGYKKDLLVKTEEATPEYKLNPPSKIKLKSGSILFLPAYQQYRISPTVGPLILYFAYSNSFFDQPEIDPIYY